MNVIKMLLMGNVDVNEADFEGNTALHWCLSGATSTKEPRCSSQILYFFMKQKESKEDQILSFPIPIEQ